jgi:spore coat assembly protein SafA
MTMPAEPSGGGGGNIFTGKIGGIPGFVWLLGAGVLAYFLFFRNSSSSTGAGATSTGGGGTATGGTTTIDTGAVQVSVSQAAPTTSNAQTTNAQQTNPSVAQTHPAQPQPSPTPPPKVAKTHPAIPAPAKAKTTTVTVAKFPGKSTNGEAQWNTTMWGIANHYGISLQTLEAANPQVKNPNLIYPGQKITVPTS